MNKIILGGVVTILAGLVLIATGWNFSAVADIPNKYVTKEEQRIYQEKNNEDHCRIQDKVDKIYDYLIKGGGSSSE